MQDTKNKTDFASDKARAIRERWEVMLHDQIIEAGLPKPIWAGSDDGQYKVCRPGHSHAWRVDFYWSLDFRQREVIVEVLGGEFQGGSKYARGGVALRKWVERLRWLVKLGYRVYCFTGQEVNDGTAIEWLREEFKGRTG